MAVSGSLRLPPPPLIAQRDPTFNRWLLEITSILSQAGGIDPTQIVGWNELVAAVAANTADVLTLQNSISALTNAINLIAVRTTALEARGQVLNGVGAPAAGLGSVNDWYANIGGAVGARIYVKTAVATWTAFPF